MSSDSHATITYTSMSSYEVIVNGYFGMHMDPLDSHAQLVIEAPPSPDYIPEPKAPPSPDYIPGQEYPEFLPPTDDVFPAEEQPLSAAVSPTAESPGYIADSEPEMDPEEEDGDDEKSEGDSIDYPTSRGDDDANDDGDDLLEDDADDEDEEESSDSKEEEEEHLASIVPASALHSSISASDQTETFEEGETAATPPPSAYRVTARISIRPHIPMPFPSESEVERLLAIPTPQLSLVLPTSYLLPPFLMPLHIFTPLPPPPPIILPRTSASVVLMRSVAPSTFILAPLSRTPPIGTPPLLPIPLPTSSFPLPLLLPSTSCREGIPEADMPLQKRTRFTTLTGGYEVSESSIAAAARSWTTAIMSSDSHATITYTSMSSYEVIVNGYFGMPMDPLDPHAQLVIEAPPSPDYIPEPKAPPSPDYIPGQEYIEFLPPTNDVFLAEEQPLPAAVSPTAESPGYIADSEPEMDPEEEDGDDEKSEGDSIDYPTSRGDDDANDDGDDLLEDDADDEDEEESSDSKEEEEEHLASIVPSSALHSSISASDQTETFEEGKTAATPPPSAYRVTARISVRPHIPMPFPSESECICGSDEICCTIYIYSSTTIEDTTDRDTT
nr:hypothetical protein [Tanacetum cinerariifolium]